jgi:hypothetical protein
VTSLRLRLILAVVLAVAGASARAEAQRRVVAIVVGVNQGLDTDETLQFAEQDAARVARAWIDSESVPAANVQRLLGADRGKVTRTLDGLAPWLQPDDWLLFFFSGHGSERGLHLKGDVLPWGDLRQRLMTLRARVVLAFVDTCQSGAILTPKGFIRDAPLKVKAASLTPSGRVLITSSGASEISSESRLLQGSPFTQALASGWRGAADADHDGRVTLGELYHFIYGRTVASTLSAPAGPQHPAQELLVRGTGDLVVSASVAGRPRLRRTSIARGDCYVLDRREVEILAALPPAPNSWVALAPATYVIKCVEDRRLWTAKATLHQGDLALESLGFHESTRVLALAKGGDATSVHRLELAAGALWESAPGWTPSLALRYRRGERGVWGLQLRGSARDGAASLAASVEMGSRLPWWDALGSRLELGLQTGADARLVGSEDGRLAVLVGAYFHLHFATGERVRLAPRIDLLSVLPVNKTVPASFAVHFTFASGLEFHGAE